MATPVKPVDIVKYVNAGAIAVTFSGILSQTFPMNANIATEAPPNLIGS